MEYKVLTLWQPWATLLVYGFKKIETRPSFTSWTINAGTYLIHAARKWSVELDAISKQPPFKEVLKGLPIITGAIIGSIDVVDCYSIMISYEDEINLVGYDIELSENEIAFGDYREGRYAWICESPKVLIKPIPYKNGQGYYQNFNGNPNQLIFKP